MRVSHCITGAIALSLAALSARAEESSVALRRGAELYAVHCATCHGIEATGRGPMAGVLVIAPSDLTALSAAGVFPVERVVRRIDGTDPLVSHGSAMPVYGPFFEGKGRALRLPDGRQIMTSQPIADLLAYLETLQSK
jgi:mono/diheme cytochrome c family protein